MAILKLLKTQVELEQRPTPMQNITLFITKRPERYAI